MVLRREDTGALAIIVALFATAILAFGALVVEVGADREARRSAQSAADSAALAAAHAYDKASGTPSARMTAGFNAATEYAHDNFPAGRTQADYWDGCVADPVGGGTWVNEGGTSCVAFREGGLDGRHTRVQVVVPGLQTSRLFGAVAGKVRALAQARIPTPDVPGLSADCLLCVRGPIVGDVGQISVEGDAHVGDALTFNNNNGRVTATGEIEYGSWNNRGILSNPHRLGPAVPDPFPTVRVTPGPGPAVNGSGACLPGVYSDVSGCTSFGAGLYVVAGTASVTFNAAASNVVFYFTCATSGVPQPCAGSPGATVAGGSAAITGRTASPYQGFAFIFDPTSTAGADLGDLDVHGAVYSPSTGSTLNASGSGAADVWGNVVFGAITLDGNTEHLRVHVADTSTLPLPIDGGTSGLVR